MKVNSMALERPASLRGRLAATKQEMQGRKATGGYTAMELIVVIAVIAILSVTGVALYFVLSANARENAAQSVAIGAHNAVQSYYTDYGTLPDEDAVDAYLTRSGDVPVSEALPEGATLTVYRANGVPAPNATVTIITSTSFDDVIIIGRSGAVTKVPSADFDAADFDAGAVIAEWSNVAIPPGDTPPGDDD